MTVKPLVHEVRIQNQVIFLDPPIEQARASWVHQLHEWLGMCFPPRKFGELTIRRRCLPLTENPKFAIRNWLADAEHRIWRGDLHFTGLLPLLTLPYCY